MVREYFSSSLYTKYVDICLEINIERLWKRDHKSLIIVWIIASSYGI